MSEDADLTQGVGWVTSMAGIMKFSKLLLLLLPRETAQHHRTCCFMPKSVSASHESSSRKHCVIHEQNRGKHWTHIKFM